MNRKVVFAPGEFYHVYNRGVDRREIFLDEHDYHRFVQLLFVANGSRAFEYRNIKGKNFSEIERDKPLVAIGAYCLMPNHFHILIKEITDQGLSDFMEKLTTSYSKYFNGKYGRVGTLFQGRFQAQHANNDTYLKYLFAYIHLNPIKLIDSNWKETGIQNRKQARVYLMQYQHSSFLDYAAGLHTNRDVSQVLSKKEFPEYFLHNFDFIDFIDDWMAYQD